MSPGEKCIAKIAVLAILLPFSLMLHCQLQKFALERECLRSGHDPAACSHLGWGAKP